MIATCLALTGFAAALLGGLSAGNTAAVTLGRALVSMMVCYVAGLAIGYAGQAAVHEHVEQYRKNRPLSEASGVAESGGPGRAAAGEAARGSQPDVTRAAA